MMCHTKPFVQPVNTIYIGVRKMRYNRVSYSKKIETLSVFGGIIGMEWGNEVIRVAMIRLPHSSIRITIQTLRYDMYHDTWKNLRGKNK
jgi:hypothetical protein